MRSARAMGLMLRVPVTPRFFRTSAPASANVQAVSIAHAMFSVSNQRCWCKKWYERRGLDHMPSQGMKGEALTTCKLGQNTAAVMGSGDLEVRHTHVHFIAQRQKNKLCQSVVYLPIYNQVFATPAMVALMEQVNVCLSCVCAKKHTYCVACVYRRHAEQ